MGTERTPWFRSAIQPHVQPLTPRIKRHRFPEKLFAPAAAVALSIFILHPSKSDASVITQRPAPPAANPVAANPRPSTQFVIPPTPAFSYDGGTLGLENSPEGLSLVYRKEGQSPNRVPLDVGFEDMIGTITRIHYGIGHSVIMAERVLEDGATEYYAVITLGARDVAEGRAKLPGSEILNSYAVVLPEMPLASSFTESALFVFAEGGVVRFVPLGSDEGMTCKLSGLDGVGAQSIAMEYMGLYFIMQPGAVPLYVTKRDGDDFETVPWDYAPGSSFTSLRVEMGENGFTIVFASPAGSMRMDVSVPEEGGLHSVGASMHR